LRYQGRTYHNTIGWYPKPTMAIIFKNIFLVSVKTKKLNSFSSSLYAFVINVWYCYWLRGRWCTQPTISDCSKILGRYNSIFQKIVSVKTKKLNSFS